MKRNKGFTLIELSIVLVLIGLIIGGILKGAEIIEATKIKKVITALDETKSSIYVYSDKYNALPGDDIRAQDWFGSSFNVGNGDNDITGYWFSATANDESYGFWQHLRAANLIKGSTDVNAENFLPKSPFLGNYFVETWVFGGAYPTEGIYNFVATKIPGSACIYADRKLDDGNTRAGTVRTYVPMGSVVPSPDPETLYSLYIWFS